MGREICSMQKKLACQLLMSEFLVLWRSPILRSRSRFTALLQRDLRHIFTPFSSPSWLRSHASLPSVAWIPLFLWIAQSVERWSC